jgi:hypothetical protein
MTNGLSRLGAIVLSSMLAIPAMAQMDNTVEVETSVTPIVKDANKINVLPEIVESQAKHYDVNYSTAMMQTKKYVFTPVDMMAAETMGSGAGKGFVSAGGGMPGTLDLRGAYGFDLSRNDVLGVRISCGGFNGKATNKDLAPKGSNYKSRFYTTRGGVDYTHKYAHGLSELFIKLGLESQVFNYQFPFSTETDKQRNSLGNVSIGTTDYRVDDFRISGDFGYSFFNQNHLTNLTDKYSESQIHLNTDLGYYFNEENSLNVDFGILNSSYGMDGVKGYTHAHVLPYYKFDDYDMTLKLGAYIGANGVAPDLRIDYRLSEFVNIYAHAIGYDGETGLKSFNALHPYSFLPKVAGTDYKIKTEFHQIDARLGLRFRSETGWAGDINAGYDKVKNRAELTPISTASPAPYITFVNGNRFYANLDLAYNFEDVVKIDLKNQFNAWGIDKAYKNTVIKTRPVVDLDWNFDFRLTKGLFMGADWKLQSFAKTKDTSSSSSTYSAPYKRPTTFNLGLSAHYTFSPVPLSIYANVDNLLNCKYDRFYGYRAIGTTFIAGVAYTF